MDPCHFVRLTVLNLSLKPPPSPPSRDHPLSYHCKIKFNHSIQSSPLPLHTTTTTTTTSSSIAACFSLSKTEIDKIVHKDSKNKNKQCLKVDVCAVEEHVNGVAMDRFVGRVRVPIDLGAARSGGNCVLQNGWVGVGKKKKRRENRDSSSSSAVAQVYVTVKAEADPRFVFEFDGEPECNPQVFQVLGNVRRQPVFSCSFCFRSPTSCSSMSSEPSTSSSSWLSSILHRRKGQTTKMRKGWSITIHDLSGSPVAAASIIAPFMPMPGSNQVSKCNPGAWLILRPGEGTWKPWGRLEAWRERGITDSLLGYRFELLPDSNVGGGGPAGVAMFNGSISAKNGGKFSIDLSTYGSPVTSPNGSFDLGSGSGSGFGSGSDSGSGWWMPQFLYRGFVMSSTVGGKRKGSKPPLVEVGAQHVTCIEDAAVFVVLAAAMDLSMDACKLFSQKLRKELRHHSGELGA